MDLNFVMRKILLLTAIISVAGCMNTSDHQRENQSKDALASYSIDDLQKIRWIEGKWKGTYKQKPFYEIYHFKNDTTLEIVGFEWNGRDSSNSQVSTVHWKNGAYYLGEEDNWKVTAITPTSISMVPNFKAANTIVWQYNDSTSWNAILETKTETNEYHMQAFDPFRGKD